MIHRLFIKNFAIINELSLPLKKGLTVITGETGAGKSIILKSLGITLGASGDKTDVRSGQKNAIVEAELTIESQEKILRRLISKGGRTRSFMDDEPMAEQEYRDSVSSYADFHGQHEQQYIMNAGTHIDFLDSFCNSNNMVQKIEETFVDLTQTIKELDTLIAKQKNAANQKELLQFQVQEIQSIDPQIDEDIKLGKEFKRLNHVEELVSTVQRLNQTLTENDHSIYRQLASTVDELNRLSTYDDSLTPYLESIEQAAVSIQDASAELIHHIESLELDENHLQEVEERLQAIEGLKRKYGGSIERVQSFIQESEKELDELSGLDKAISTLESEKIHLTQRYQKIADQLHGIRRKYSNDIGSKIEKEMVQLNMAGAKFDVRISQSNDPGSAIVFEDQPVKYGPKGYDQIEFYLSANPGEIPKPLTKIASGGEVSRIMLAIKSVLKKYDPVDTLIFDEIDSGISGQAAEKVSEALEKLSKDKQVICITHLPQIASRADHHLYIHKTIHEDKTSVSARYLNDEEKIKAIAELFSGDIVTREGITSAQQFMDQARG
ncbi:MAG: DNA repair protein RecN [Candidatus Marinimicrobia bacterium]|nr:DNA repair protein RecN [Candidatus Neomarinimicrobiota bacterium]MBL7010526.1 DNA repair protein RecN [Candidatus Neomarinimicrobiota bacterium]MBL7030446.1 DNA repair protein RecN [Candidatus Neomarinimicrobiota bacterium]